AVDRKRAKVFSKLSRMITVAAKLGGGDPGGNPRLRLAIEKARVVSMTKDTIERAIKKGTGELDGQAFEEILYEGYAAGGVALLVEILTDNKHRTAPEIRNLFDQFDGNLAATGSVAWMFERRAAFLVQPGGELSEEKLMDVALGAGADDLVTA